MTRPPSCRREPLLSARDVSVSFPVGSRVAARIRGEERLLRAVDGVDLEMRRGEALALVGESGSGKSTLAQALVGLLRTDRGEIRFDGRVLPASRSRADRRRIQMVFQDPYSSLNPRLTVGGMLRELLRVHHVVPANRVATFSAELLALVGLGEADLSAYPRQFSGGQRQRVAIARALALRPDVLVADEPVSALDVSVQATILNLLSEPARRPRAHAAADLPQPGRGAAPVRPGRGHVPGPDRRGRAHRADLQHAPPPLHPGPARRDPPDDRGRRGRQRPGHRRRPAEPAAHPGRVPVPHPLPDGAAALRDRRIRSWPPPPARLAPLGSARLRWLARLLRRR